MGNGASAAQDGERVARNYKGTKVPRKKKSRPACDPKIVWSLLDRMVPDLSRTEHEAEFVQLMDSVEVVRVDADTRLTEAGKTCGKMYHVQTGLVEVYVDDSVDDVTTRHPVSLLGPGDFCGEIGVLFNRPATATSTAKAGSELLSLDGASVLTLLTTFPHSLVDWMLQMRYIWLDVEDEGRQWYCRLVMAALEKVPPFHAWPKDCLANVLASTEDQGLSKGAPPWVLVSYPTGAPVVVEGDPPGDMRILVKGRVGAYRQGEKITTVQAKKYPFAFGEEGIVKFINDLKKLFIESTRETKDDALFTDRCHVLSVVAENPCLVIHVTLDDLEDRKTQWGPSVSEALGASRDFWTYQMRSRNEELYDEYGHLLALEMLYKTLRETDLFMSSDPLAVQLVARLGLAEWCGSGDIFTADPAGLYLVTLGCLEPVYTDREELLLSVGKLTPGPTYRASDLANADRANHHMSFPLRASKDTLVVKFPWSDFLHVLRKFSEDQLGKLSDALHQRITPPGQAGDEEDGVTMETFNDTAPMTLGDV